MLFLSRPSLLLIMALIRFAPLGRAWAFSSVSNSQASIIRQTRIRVFSTTLPSSKSAESSSSSSFDTQQPLSEVPTIVLKRSRQSKAFRNGNQLVFTRAIQSGTAPLASLVEVAVENSAPNDKKQAGKTLNPLSMGWGVYNPNSLYKIRILCHRYLQPALYKSLNDSENAKDAMRLILNHHFQIAIQKRRALNLPSSQHTVYRLVNGEGDGLSGLQVDVMDSHVVIQSSAAWCQLYKDVILETLGNAMPDHKLIWKVAASRLIQDGFDNFVEDTEGPEAEEAVVVKENGVMFKTYPAALGQKTGVYCDQRENRYLLSQYTRDKTVLDLCCFQGGFSVTAVVSGGAKLAVGIDSSPVAVEAAQKNAKLNQCEEKVTFIQSDISTYMQQAAEDSVHYDVVVLDPPKLAPTAASLDKARRKYHGLNRDAIKLVNPTGGGMLMTCTCSAAMTQKDGGDYFLAMVAAAAQAAGRSITLLKKEGAASCHTQSPVCQPAGAYLTAALFYVHPAE